MKRSGVNVMEPSSVGGCQGSQWSHRLVQLKFRVCGDSNVTDLSRQSPVCRSKANGAIELQAIRPHLDELCVSNLFISKCRHLACSEKNGKGPGGSGQYHVVHVI